MSVLLDHDALEEIALGATVLGSGGRGNPTLGKLMAQQAVAQHGPIQLLSLNRTTKDWHTSTLQLEKVETTPQDPARGVLHSFEKANAKLSNIDYFVHGTTLGLNALLTRTGARVAIVTTKGFRDIYELGRTSRDMMYDLKYRKPNILVPRYLAFEVAERCDFQGNVLTPFNRAEAIVVAQQLRAHGVEAAADRTRTGHRYGV